MPGRPVKSYLGWLLRPHRDFPARADNIVVSSPLIAPATYRDRAIGPLA